MAVESILPAASTPTRVGEHLCLSVLGHGTLARVYLARPLSGGPPVALKLVHRGPSRDPALVQTLLGDAQRMAGLEHPCVVGLRGVGSHAGRAYLVLDYVEGDSVESFLRMARALRKRLPAAMLLRVALDALEGLGAVHEARDARGEPRALVHGDVKPGNLLAGVDGRVRVTDVGLARALGTSLLAPRMRRGRAWCTLEYRSPEQRAGREADARSDAWSLAVTLWECLALEALGSDGTPQALAAVIDRESYLPLGSTREDLPVGLDGVLSRALARDPSGRFPTAGAFREALLACAGDAVASRRDLAAFVAAMAGPRVAAERRALATAAMGLSGPLCRPRSRRPAASRHSEGPPRRSARPARWSITPGC
jgi:serine/threonine-protein kinase